MTDTISELRLALRAAGHAPLPACGKEIHLPEWTTKGSGPEEEIASWAIKHPKWTNTGKLCSTTPVLDIDITQPEAAEAIADLVRDWFDGRGTILTRTGEAPKRASHSEPSGPSPRSGGFKSSRCPVPSPMTSGQHRNASAWTAIHCRWHSPRHQAAVFVARWPHLAKCPAQRLAGNRSR